MGVPHPKQGLQVNLCFIRILLSKMFTGICLISHLDIVIWGRNLLPKEFKIFFGFKTWRTLFWSLISSLLRSTDISIQTVFLSFDGKKDAP